MIKGLNHKFSSLSGKQSTKGRFAETGAEQKQRTRKICTAAQMIERRARKRGHLIKTLGIQPKAVSLLAFENVVRV
jgi:hypothetical protein